MIFAWKSLLVLCIVLGASSKPHICNICTCGKGFSVDCSNRNLTEIPYIPKDMTVKSFFFNGNYLKELSADVLQNIPATVDDLYFQNCGIKTIKNEKLFQNLPKLNKLSIGDNDLSQESIENLFGNFDLPVLNVSGINFGQFERTLNISLSKKIKSLMLNKCNISNIGSIIKTRMKMKLKQLELVGNRINSDSLQSFTIYGKYYGKLNLIKLSSNPITQLPVNTFATLIHLRRLMLCKLGDFFFFRGINSSSLVLLDLTGSLTCGSKLDFGQMFNLTPALITLNLARSNFSDVTDVDFYDMVSPLKNLSTLDLSDSLLSFVPCLALRSLHNLEVLDLSRNEITGWSDNCFTNMSSSLRKLYLHRNNITVINKTSFPVEFLEQLSKLYLYGNPYSCVCSLHWFRDWMRDSDNYQKLDVLNSYRNGTYACFSPPELKNTLLVDFDPNFEICGFPTILVIGGVVISLLFLSTITLIIVKRIHTLNARQGYHKIRTCHLTKS